MTRFFAVLYANGENTGLASYMYTNKQYKKIQSYTRNSKKNNVNSKQRLTPSVWSNAMCRISQLRTHSAWTFIVEQSDSVNIYSASKLFFLSQLSMFGGKRLNTFWYSYKLAMKIKSVSKRQLSLRWVRNHMFTSLSLVN